MMKSIIFLLLVAVAGSIAETSTECRDVLGHCNVVKANCKSPQAQTQMKKLCAKTCGFCQKEEETKAPTPKRDEPKPASSEVFTLELFLLYIKNDIKFLKEEITDVKFRLRDLSSRKQVVASAEVQQREDPRLAGELNDLKLQTQRLASRIQDQTDRFSALLSNFSLNLSTVKQNFTGEIVKIQRDILELSEELRRDAGKIEALDNLDDQIKDVRDDMDIMNKQTRVYIASFNQYFRNLSSNVAERFFKLQEQFYNVLNDERVKVIELGKKLENVTDALHRERQRTAKLERFMDEFSVMPSTGMPGNGDQRQIDALTFRIQNFTRLMRSQEIKTSMLTALVEEIQKKPAAETFDEERAKINQLQSKFSYAMRRVDILVQKTNQLQAQLNQTRREASSNSRDERVDELLTQLNTVTDQLEGLKSKTARNQVSDSFQKLMEQMKNQSASAPPLAGSMQNLQMFSKLSVDVDALKARVSDDTARIDALTKKVDEVSANATTGIFGIKQSIESMADLRNNESITIGELNNKYQRGIMSLLGPQQANNTRFYKPRFDWENGRLTIYGYIAINRQGEWGTICDDSFDEKEAAVLCRQAGYKGGAYENGKYKISDGVINGMTRSEHRIWIDELRCEGTELSLEDCRHGSEGWGVHDCDHGEDVGIKCYVS